jgi:lipoyl(octanoyl) transferase
MKNRLVHFQDLGIKEYKETWDFQEEIFTELIKLKGTNHKLSEKEKTITENHLFLVEHPHVYTLGKSGSENNLLINIIQMKKLNVSFFKTNRGGDITYHGPGQIVGYPILDLENFDLGLKEYIHQMEEVIILTLQEFGIKSERLDGATGVWLDTNIPGKSRKICAIGVKSSRHITMHGFAFNVNTDLDFFNFINPCGFTDKAVTSLEKELGIKQNFEAVKEKVKANFARVFGMDFQ